MKIRKKLTLLGMFTLLCSLFIGITQVQAKATKIRFETREYRLQFDPDPEKWITGHTLHIRNQWFVFRVFDGDFTGLLTYIGDMDINLATGEGTGRGTNSFEGLWLGTNGPWEQGSHFAFEGRSVLSVTGFGTENQDISGKAVSHSSDGMLIRSTFTDTGELSPNEVTNWVQFDGVILNPHR